MSTFWLILTVLALLWYSIVTFYVALKGIGDVTRLLRGHDKEDERPD